MLFLVDSSAWIAFFRGDPAAVAQVRPRLENREVAVCGPIYAEVLSGAPTPVLLEHFRRLLKSLIWLPDFPGLWERVAETRFHLARKGLQAHIVDVMIAVEAVEAASTLLTRDRDFQRIQQVLPLSLVLF